MLAIYHKVNENGTLHETVSEFNIPEEKTSFVPPIKAMDVIWIKINGEALYMLRREFPIWGGGFASSVTLYGSIARTVYETLFHCDNPRELFQDMLINLRDA